MSSYLDFRGILMYLDSQNCSFLCSEFAEPIEILLIGATGGAVLGRHLVSRITIAKSDSPFGVVRFLNESRISLPNPNSTMILFLVLERSGGLLGEIQVYFFIPMVLKIIFDISVWH